MKYKQSIIKHQLQSTIAKKCNICNVTFNNVQDQLKHSQQHPIDLDIDTRTNLNVTTAMKSSPLPEKKFFFGSVKNEATSPSPVSKCRTCGRNYRDLQDHQIRHSKKSIKEHFPCNECGYKFLTRQQCDSHVCEKK